MNDITILLADNDPAYLESQKRFLSEKGYNIITATDPLSAKFALEQGDIDLAILDVRLLNDDDDKDFSGLDVARTAVTAVPKIMLTRFPTVDAVRQSLGSQLDGMPPAVDFVSKQEGDAVLLTAIENALLSLKPKFQRVNSSVVEDIARDYEAARQQAGIYFAVSLVVSIVAIVFIFLSVAQATIHNLATGILRASAIVIVQSVTYLFFDRMLDKANKRAYIYHRERLETRQLESLLASCNEIEMLDSKVRCKEMIIEKASIHWFRQQEIDL